MSADRSSPQSTLGRVARDKQLRDRFEADPEATLVELGLDEAERAGMLRYGAQRLLAYHEMVHSRLSGTIRSFLGPAAEVLGRDRLRFEVDEWIAGPGPHTPYLRDIPGEFVAWARPRWSSDPETPAWLVELADHQISIRTIRNDPREVGSPTELSLALERPIVCNPTIRLLRYRWAVHRLPKGFNAASDPPSEAPTIVAGFRGANEQPTFVELEPRAAALLERLIAGASLRDALFGACEALGEALDDAILSVTALTLADLLDRHVLLGAAPE